MNWQIEWGDYEQIFGYDFHAILAEGIERGMEDLDDLQLLGHVCEVCGKFRMTHTVDRHLVPYEMCLDCWNKEFPHVHICQQCDRIVKEECTCGMPQSMTWCSANCRAAYDL